MSLMLKMCTSCSVINVLTWLWWLRMSPLLPCRVDTDPRLSVKHVLAVPLLPCAFDLLNGLLMALANMP